MSHALFLAPLASPSPGDEVKVTGPEARHAVAVRRIRVGESVLIADGQGHAIRGPVTSARAECLVVRVVEVLESPRHPHRLVAVQALAKGERSELAVETMTELGVSEILAWQASRSIVRWQGERGAKALTRWASTAREATKQSRRFLVPKLSAVSTRDVVARIGEAACTLVLHEEARLPIRQAALPDAGEVLVIIGPEGGITAEELAAFEAAGAQSVTISDGVLRTSTAGAAALAQLEVLLAR